MDNTRMYSERYDAFYNPETDTWLDSQCCDPTCEYCQDRPEFPSQVENHDAK